MRVIWIAKFANLVIQRTSWYSTQMLGNSPGQEAGRRRKLTPCSNKHGKDQYTIMSPKSTVHLTTLSRKREVAHRLGISLNSLHTLIDEGELTKVPVGKRSVRISDAEVEAFIARRVARAKA